jgi:hypothetical protein
MNKEVVVDRKDAVQKTPHKPGNCLHPDITGYSIVLQQDFYIQASIYHRRRRPRPLHDKLYGFMSSGKLLAQPAT